MRVLIIGGSYFVGRALVRGFLQDHHQVTVLNRGTRPLQGVEQLVADRNVSQQIVKALRKRSFDWVVDTSCYTLDQCRVAFRTLTGHFEHWIQLSTSAVYVEDGTIPMDENHPTGKSPEWGDYGLFKWQADDFLLREARETRSSVTIMRPPYLYGPGNNSEREQFFWSRLLRGRPILLPGSGQTPIQFLHTDDLYGFIRLALENPELSAGQVFNLANRKAITFRSLVELLAQLAGVSATLVPVPYQSLGLKSRDFFPFRDFPCVVDVLKAENTLGWAPRYDLRTGFAQTCQSYDRSWLETRAIDTTIEDRILETIGRRYGDRFPGLTP